MLVLSFKQMSTNARIVLDEFSPKVLIDHDTFVILKKVVQVTYLPTNTENWSAREMKTIKSWALGVAILTVLSTTSVKAELITNGSFELATIDPGAGFLHVLPGQTSITGWDVITEDVHYMGTFWEASDGIRSIDLDGLINSAGGLSQTISTVAGTEYEVTFDMAGNYGNFPVIKPMRVSADGQSLDFFFDITGRSAFDMGWTSMSWLFTADDATAVLEFQSLTISPQGWGAALDNVSVNALAEVPAPATIWLFGIGLIGLVRHWRVVFIIGLSHSWRCLR